MKIYFGHSRMFYNTDTEKKAIEIIMKHYPDAEIVNPNIPEHQDDCRKSIDGDPTPGKEIGYFLDLTTPTELGCFLVYDPTKWSAGSSAEVHHMMSDGKPVFFINLTTEELEPITNPIQSYTFEETLVELENAGITEYK